MLRMVSYSRGPQSGQITCYLNRTYNVLSTAPIKALDLRFESSYNLPTFVTK